MKHVDRKDDIRKKIVPLCVQVRLQMTIIVEEDSIRQVFRIWIN
jgi:hypothetical protein